MGRKLGIPLTIPCTVHAYWSTILDLDLVPLTSVHMYPARNSYYMYIVYSTR
jgi:hypothetical protein